MASGMRGRWWVFAVCALLAALLLARGAHASGADWDADDDEFAAPQQKSDRFKDAAGNTSALLKCRHGETNKKIDGANLSISQSAGEGGVALSFGSNPYIQGHGSSVLYGPSPDGDGFTNKLGEIKPI